MSDDRITGTTISVADLIREHECDPRKRLSLDVARERRAAMTQEARDTQMRGFIGSMVRVGATDNAE